MSCRDIEAGLKQEYELHPDLTDARCSLALDNARIAIKQRFGYARNESVSHHPLATGIIEWCVSIRRDRIGKINDLTLAEYLKAIEKVKRSVNRHSTEGRRAYFDYAPREYASIFPLRRACIRLVATPPYSWDFLD